MINVSREALRTGCERAEDLFHLNRLRGHEEALASFDAVFRAHGMDVEMREQLEHALAGLVPVHGVPLLEATVATSMLAGVLVGLFIADGALPADELDLPVVPTS